jgi:hypothetical protein
MAFGSISVVNWNGERFLKDCLSDILLPALLVIFACGDSSPKLPLARLKVEFGRHNIPAEMMVAETVSADVTVKNASTKTWPSSLTKKEGMR